jgi:hypothetical protein
MYCSKKHTVMTLHESCLLGCVQAPPLLALGLGLDLLCQWGVNAQTEEAFKDLGHWGFSCHFLHFEASFHQETDSL